MYERLGAVREKAVAQWKIGWQLLAAGGEGTAQARQLLEAAYLSAVQMGLSESTQMAAQMREHGLALPEQGNCWAGALTPRKQEIGGSRSILRPNIFWPAIST